MFAYRTSGRIEAQGGEGYLSLGEVDTDHGISQSTRYYKISRDLIAPPPFLAGGLSGELKSVFSWIFYFRLRY